MSRYLCESYRAGPAATRPPVGLHLVFYVFCDNDAVVETVQNKKPRDPALLSLLREFLFVVVTEKFFPVLRKIGTKENDLADFVSRRFDPEAAAVNFSKAGLHNMQLVKPKTRFFEQSAKW